MSPRTHFTNAAIVTRDAVIEGTLTVADGLVLAVEDGASKVPGAIDFDGDYLLPGLVELHTDHLEGHYAPRPGVRWPAASAVMAHDAQVAAAGITTVFDALAVGDVADGSERVRNLQAMADGVVKAQDGGMLRAEHFLHLRCEVSHGGLPDLFRPFVGHPLVRLLSVMDHTPGQRQFASLEAYASYYKNKHKLDDHQFEVFTRDRLRDHELYSGRNRELVVGVARELGIVIASHDDATEGHVAESVEYGATIAEFPTTHVAAEAARAAGLAVLGGAPNVVRGGSHSGNVSVADLAARGLLDILSSDYVPSSLMHAAFALARETLSLPRAVALVSETPARVVGLDDRGVIEAGRLADFARVRLIEGVPVVRGVWRRGERII